MSVHLSRHNHKLIVTCNNDSAIKFYLQGYFLKSMAVLDSGRTLASFVYISINSRLSPMQTALPDGFGFVLFE